MRWYLFLIVSCLPVALSLRADEPMTVNYRLGVDFRRVLELPGGGTWSKVPLGDALRQIESVQRIFILLDRRIDPEQLLDYEAPQASLEVSLRGIAARMKLGVSIGDGWVYFGPPDSASILQTLIELRGDDARKLDVSKAWFERRVLEFGKVSAPADLIREELQRLDIEAVNMNRFPVDLWSARRWPALDRITMLSLITIQFDRTWRWNQNGVAIEWISIPQQVVLTRSYTVANQKEFADKLSSFQLGLKIDVVGREVRVTGSAELHHLARDLAAGRTAKQTRVSEGEARFTLNAKQPVGAFIRALAGKLQLKLIWDEAALTAAGIELDRQVEVEVREVTREALLEAVLKPAGMRAEIRGEELHVLQRQ